MRASRPAASTSETISSLLIALASTGPRVDERLAAHIERSADQREEQLFVARLDRRLRERRELQHRRVHLRPRHEAVRRYVEQDLRLRVVLYID